MKTYTEIFTEFVEGGAPPDAILGYVKASVSILDLQKQIFKLPHEEVVDKLMELESDIAHTLRAVIHRLEKDKKVAAEQQSLNKFFDKADGGGMVH